MLRTTSGKQSVRSKIALMKTYLAEVISFCFLVYTVLLFLRIICSWFPSWYRFNVIRFVAFLTDPYLNLFRKILPPLGGVLDISPILAFFVLRILEMILLGFLR